MSYMIGGGRSCPDVPDRSTRPCAPREEFPTRSSNAGDMKRLLLAAAIIGVLAVSVPAHADVRCSAVATGATAAGCRYTASGPGTFAVNTASGYVVLILRGQQVITVSQSAGPMVASGAIPSLPGDIVDIAIKKMWVRDYHNSPVVEIQDGVIAAHE
jgi:hypothetical protein